MTKVLVAGAAGQLGREVVERLAGAGHDVAARTRAQLDTGDARSCRHQARSIAPRVIIDCAEHHPDLDRGTRAPTAALNLAVAARSVAAFSIYVSCAEVFDGETSEPYVEGDAPRPRDSFGMAKRAAERAVVTANPDHAVIRTAWLFGPGGTGGNLVEAVLAAAQDSDRVPVDAETRSHPTYAGHLADALVTLVEEPAYGTFHLAAIGACTKLEFARAVLRGAGSDAQAVPLDSSAGIVPKRNLMLGTQRREVPRLPPWEVGLATYLQARERAANTA
jgi:dTDP-4-dehydrorhamnose reductase